MTDANVKNESKTMVAAGFETTALVASYCLLMAAMHPGVQHRMYEEIAKTVPNPDEVTYEHLTELKYLERVLKETMRLFPLVVFVGRKTVAPLQLGPHSIPTDTNLLVSTMGLHRDKAVWGADADQFDPDRFLADRIRDIHPYAYVPFSGGPRNCIGHK